jgi:YfiH family protein
MRVASQSCPGWGWVSRVCLRQPCSLYTRVMSCDSEHRLARPMDADSVGSPIVTLPATAKSTGCGLWRPDWPLPVGVEACCTTRQGGHSQPPWQTFNLGSHVGDDPAHVAANRVLLRRQLARAGAHHTAFLEQVHGWQVVQMSSALPDGTRADGCLAGLPGLACTIMVADCLPVLLASADGAVVAAAHAGWRGLAGPPTGEGGILEATVRAMREALAALKRPAEGAITAWLGPCIGPQAFEVGAEVRQAFGPQGDLHFQPAQRLGHYQADLPALARMRLQQAGVESIHGNDGGPDWCTYSQPERYFSHRRDAARLGSTGRMAVSIWRIAQQA